MWRGNMTPYYFRRVVGEGGRRATKVASKNQRTIAVSGIMESETVSPSPLSIITRWDRHGRTSLSTSHVCVSGEADPIPTRFGTEEETAKKNQHVVIFQTMEISLLPFIHHRVRTHNVFPFIPQRMKRHKELLFVRWKTKNIIWDMKETQIPK